MLIVSNIPEYRNCSNTISISNFMAAFSLLGLMQRTNQGWHLNNKNMHYFTDSKKHFKQIIIHNLTHLIPTTFASRLTSYTTVVFNRGAAHCDEMAFFKALTAYNVWMPKINCILLCIFPRRKDWCHWKYLKIAIIMIF